MSGERTLLIPGMMPADLTTTAGDDSSPEGSPRLRYEGLGQPGLTADTEERRALAEAALRQITGLDEEALTAAVGGKDCLYELINILVHIFGIGGIVEAMLPQGAAAYVQSEALGGTAAKLSEVIGVGSFGGKTCLISFFSANKFAGYPSTYNNVAKAIRHPFTAENWYDKNAPGGAIGSTLIKITGVIPGITFGLLSFVTMRKFVETVNKLPNSGKILQWLAKAAANQGVVWSCAVGALGGNLISANGIISNAIRLGKGLVEEGRRVRAEKCITEIRLPNAAIASLSNSETPTQDKVDFAGKIVLGGAITAVTAAGMWNFYSLSRDLLKEYFNSSNIAASIFGGLQYTFMGIMSFGAGVGLANDVIEFIRGVIREGKNYLPPKGQAAINIVAGLIALGIVIPGGLPNVFQANLVNEDAAAAILADVGSAIMELWGTYRVVKLIPDAIYKKAYPEPTRGGYAEIPEKHDLESRVQQTPDDALMRTKPASSWTGFKNCLVSLVCCKKSNIRPHQTAVGLLGDGPEKGRETPGITRQ